jgi:hypothetical protein
LRLQKKIMRIMLGCRSRESYRKQSMNLKILLLPSQYILHLSLSLSLSHSLSLFFFFLWSKIRKSICLILRYTTLIRDNLYPV